MMQNIETILKYPGILELIVNMDTFPGCFLSFDIGTQDKNAKSANEIKSELIERTLNVLVNVYENKWHTVALLNYAMIVFEKILSRYFE